MSDKTEPVWTYNPDHSSCGLVWRGIPVAVMGWGAYSMDWKQLGADLRALAAAWEAQQRRQGQAGSADSPTEADRVRDLRADLERVRLLREGRPALLDTFSAVESAIRRALEAEEYGRLCDVLLAQRADLLKAIPGCAAHGDDCVPYAVEWVGKAREALAERDWLRAELEAVRQKLDRELAGTAQCVHCGWVYHGEKRKAIESHYQTCPSHPMRAVEAELEQARKALGIKFERGEPICIPDQRAEVVRLQAIVIGLAERVCQQSDQLSRNAEKKNA